MSDDPPQRSHYLPNFCAGQTVLATVLIVELTALVVTLGRGGAAVAFWTDLARTSLFLVWIGLAGQAALCIARRRLEALPVGAGAAAVLAIVCGIVLVVSEVAYRVGASGLLDAGGMDGLFPHEHLAFIGRNLAIAFIVTALALRYCFVTHEWRRNIEMQSRARVNALQARIRPHFLFNSMNTIASLIRKRPQDAERAVEDLSDLFRAALGTQEALATMGEELDLIEQYLRIEGLRLGEKLVLDIDVSALPREQPLPPLLLQPLIENAVYHGIQRLPQGGTLHVLGKRDQDMIEITIRNPTPRDRARPGNAHALANVRARIEYHFGDKGKLQVHAGEEEFQVTVRLPVGAMK